MNQIFIILISLREEGDQQRTLLIFGRLGVPFVVDLPLLVIYNDSLHLSSIYAYWEHLGFL